MATAMGAGSSNGSSSESEFSAPDTVPEDSNSPVRSPDTTTKEDFAGPFLELVEPPVESYRFRYPTEMKGTHGSIMGISTTIPENVKKKIYPTVRLHNYNPSSSKKKIIIRCTLTTADKNIEARIPHVHQLKGKAVASRSQSKNEEIDDPIDVDISPSKPQAVFSNMTILYIKKDGQLKELVNKKMRHIQGMYPYQKVMFSESDINELRVDALKQVAEMNLSKLNTACLKFEALEIGIDHLRYEPICQPIYSKPIKNTKSSQYNDLRITRTDKIDGKCSGGEEVFIFVQQVNRKDIKVRFFELNEFKEEVWEADAEFTEDDVHYQYAIAFRTPRYRREDITENVLVYYQLERPSSGCRSPPMKFEYTPTTWLDDLSRKKPRRASPPIPVTVSDLSRPSTSSSITSSRQNNRRNPSTDSAFTLSSSSTAETGETFESSFATLLDFNSDLSDLSELFKEFEQELPHPTRMEIDQESSRNPSLNEVLSSFGSSADSDALLQMLKSGGMEKWAIYNEIPVETLQHVLSEVSNSSDHQYVTDSVAKFEMGTYKTAEHQGPKSSIEQATYQMHNPTWAKPQMHIPTSMAWAADEIVVKSRSADESRMVHATHHMDTPTSIARAKHQMEFPTRQQTNLLSGSANENRPRDKLSREKIVLKVNTILNGLLKLQEIKKIQGTDVKKYLLGIFSICVGSTEDCVLHILSSNPDFPPILQTFLEVLKKYEIAEKVVNFENGRKQTALHVAAEKGSLQTISLLVGCGANVNARDINRNTAVHLAADREQNDAYHAVGHILEKNPDLTIYNQDGLTALHLFVKKRKSDVISSLIVKNEDGDFQMDLINQPDRKQGNTALHMAVQKRFLEIVSLLLNFEHRIDVNARNFEDKTPLAYVSGGTPDELKIADLLIANNAVPIPVDKDNKIEEELDEVKYEIDDDSIHEDAVEESGEVDENLLFYAQEWNSEAELKLMDRKTISSVCPVLDENKNWAKLLKKLDIDESIVLFLESKRSPSLFLLKAVAETMPGITSEKLRDTLIKINPECMNFNDSPASPLTKEQAGIVEKLPNVLMNYLYIRKEEGERVEDGQGCLEFKEEDALMVVTGEKEAMEDQHAFLKAEERVTELSVELIPDISEVRFHHAEQVLSSDVKVTGHSAKTEDKLGGKLCVALSKTNPVRIWDKKDHCLYCRKLVTNFTRHLSRRHAEEPEVAKTLVLPKGCKDRRFMFEKLKRKGNFQHNTTCIRKKTGELITVQRPSKEKDVSQFKPCKFCLGFFLKGQIYKHIKHCKQKDKFDSTKSDTDLVSCGDAYNEGNGEIHNQSQVNEPPTNIVLKIQHVGLQQPITSEVEHRYDERKFLRVPERRKVHTKKMWTPQQKSALQNHFKNYILLKKVPNKDECMKCMEENHCLSERSWKLIKFQVKNMFSKY